MMERNTLELETTMIVRKRIKVERMIHKKAMKVMTGLVDLLLMLGQLVELMSPHLKEGLKSTTLSVEWRSDRPSY